MNITGLKQRLNEIRDRHLENGYSKSYIDELDSKLTDIYDLFNTTLNKEEEPIEFLDYFIFHELEDIKRGLINKARESVNKRNMLKNVKNEREFS